MTPLQVIERVRQLGIVLTVDGADLLVDDPHGALSEDLVAELRKNKVELIDLLTSWPMKMAAFLVDHVPDADERVALVERYGERAGIAEFDGGLSEDQAERLPFDEISSLGVSPSPKPLHGSANRGNGDVDAVTAKKNGQVDGGRGAR
jgi:hypothetical protein